MWCAGSTNEISSGALQTVAQHVSTSAKPGTIPVIVFNSLGWARSGEVTVEGAGAARRCCEVCDRGGGSGQSRADPGERGLKRREDRA